MKRRSFLGMLVAAFSCGRVKAEPMTVFFPDAHIDFSKLDTSWTSSWVSIPADDPPWSPEDFEAWYRTIYPTDAETEATR